MSYETKDSGARAQFANGGQRDTEDGKARFDLVYPLNVPYEDQLVTRVAALMARGAKKYDDRNWEQFADQAALDRARSSAARHFVQWMTGEEDEDHAAAVVFNLMTAEYVAGVLAGKWPAIQPGEKPTWKGRQWMVFFHVGGEPENLWETRHHGLILALTYEQAERLGAAGVGFRHIGDLRDKFPEADVRQVFP